LGIALAAFCGAQAVAAPVSSESAVLRDIRQRGVVRCGVSSGAGLAAHDAGGRPVGMMVDFCRALAAAVLGNADAIDIRRLARPQEFPALDSGEVDVSFASSTWTLSRDAGHAIEFAGPIYFDGQAVAAWKSAEARSLANYSDAVVCVPAGSTSIVNLSDYIRRHNRRWKVRSFPSWDEAVQAFLGRDCTMLSSDRLLLVSALQNLADIRGQVTIFDDVLSREPIAPVVAASDRRWLAVVRWTMFALILGEAKGITAANVAEQRNAADTEVRRMLGGAPEAISDLGLADNWAYDVISQVGNYGDIFERHLGNQSPFRLDRGPNRPWNQGGLLYPYVFQ
jgi:general L-amino acid transport system substrate-binding protein